MPPKFDPNQELIVKFRAIGGQLAATASLAPKVGPLGLNAKKIGEDIQKSTGEWKGIKITVKLTIKNRIAAVGVEPSASSMVLQALGEPPRDRKDKTKKGIKHDGNVKFSDIVAIARKMRQHDKSMAKGLAGTVTEILGTANSIGCTVEGRSPKVVIEEVKSGKLPVPAS